MVIKYSKDAPKFLSKAGCEIGQPYTFCDSGIDPDTTSGRHQSDARIYRQQKASESWLLANHL